MNPSNPASRSYLLKVMSGPHQGAEMNLGDGEYLLGSDATCDIVLSDILLAPEHLRLVISGQQISFVALAQPTYVDGMRVAAGARPLNLFQFLTAGTTHLVIGPSDRNSWPEAATLRPPLLEAPATENHASESIDEVHEGDNGEGHLPSDEELHDPAFSEDSEHQGVISRIPKPVIWTIAALCGLVVGWGLWHLFYGGSNVPLVPVAQKDPSQIALAEMRKMPGLVRPEIVRREGRVYAQAYAQTDGQRRDAEVAISRLGLPVIPRIYSEEEILRACREVFSVLGDLQLKVNMPEPGVVAVYGFVQNPATWERVRATLREDISGLRELKDDDVYTPAKVIAVGTQMLTDNQLQREITLNMAGNQLVATGVVGGKKLDAWRQMKADLTQQLYQVMPIRDLVRMPDGTYVASLPPLAPRGKNGAASPIAAPTGGTGPSGATGSGSPGATPAASPTPKGSPTPSNTSSSSPYNTPTVALGTPTPIAPTPIPHVKVERLSGVNIGTLSYITLSNGRKYFEGALLPDFYTLVEIKPNEVTVEYNKRRQQVINGEELPQPPPGLATPIPSSTN